MLREQWTDSTMTVQDAWDRDGTHTLKDGTGCAELLRQWLRHGGMQLRQGREGRAVHRVPSSGQPESRRAVSRREEARPWSYWYSDDKLEKKDGYRNGELDGHYALWFRDGQLNVEGRHSAGEKDSIWTWYTTSGKKDQEGPFKAGLREGVWKYWYPNGQLSSTGAFAADKEKASGSTSTKAVSSGKRAPTPRGEARSVDHVVRERTEVAGRAVRERP